MFSAHVGRLIASKAAYGVTCLLAAVTLVVSGYAHKVVGLVGLTAHGITINGSPTVGAMNILVMGLESRTDYEGNALSSQLLTAMHAGSRQSVLNGTLGSQDTNTLILIHIFAGGQRAVGFSIPRDDLVTYPQAYYQGIARGKIDAAYYWAYLASLNQTANSNMSRSERYLNANQAGQKATIDTVQEITGVHIDHFVEANLAGFYYLAKAFGGIEVCIKPYPGNHGLNLTDYDPYTGTDNSGFNAYHDGYKRKKGGPQYLHLGAAQSLAFVRSRDTLPGTDIGRTHRQQATIDYVIWKLKHEGAFSDISLLDSLLGTASKYLITDSGFNMLDFATNMRALTGKNLSFQTLPSTPENGVTIPGYPNPQDVNIINVATIQKLVKNAFYPSTGKKTSAKGAKGKKGKKGKGAKKAPAVLPDSSITVDVYNGGTTTGLAGHVSQALAGLGYKAGTVANASSQSQTVTTGTQVFYGAGAAGNAGKIAIQFGITAHALKSLPAHHVEILLGTQSAAVPTGLTPSATASTSSVSATQISAESARSTVSASHEVRAHAAKTHAKSSNGSSASGTVAVAPGAKFGIPCVY